MTDRYFINALARGIRLLEVMADAGRPVTLSEVAEPMEISLSTAYRFMHTLQAVEMVERDPDSKRYRMTPKVLKLGHGLFRSSDLWHTAHPFLRQARRVYGETFNMAILDGTDILYIDRVKTQSILTINLEIGSKLPAYCTSMGRVLLAHLPPEEARRRITESRRDVYTPRTLVDAEAIMTVLEQVREEGYAVNGGELAQELWSAAAPIRNREGAVVAALNMAVNAAQHEPAYIRSVMVPAVRETAGRISEAMGYETNRNADR